MRAVATKHGTGKQRKPVSSQAAKQQQPKMSSRPASDDQDLPVRSIGKPVASKFKIAALYVASGPSGFLIPFAQAASKCLSHAAACRRDAMAAEPTGSDVVVESDDSSETASDMPSTKSSWTASSMPSSESEEEKQLYSDSDSSETASSMPSSDESEEVEQKPAAPQGTRKLERRHVRTSSQPVPNAGPNQHEASVVQDLVTQNL